VLTSIRFENFKVLRDAELMLGPLTLMIGPNGSGKSTALEGLRLLRDQATIAWTTVVSSGASKEDVRVVASDGSRTALSLDAGSGNQSPLPLLH
jgi:predicted ATPase